MLLTCLWYSLEKMNNILGLYNSACLVFCNDGKAETIIIGRADYNYFTKRIVALNFFFRYLNDYSALNFLGAYQFSKMILLAKKVSDEIYCWVIG